MNERGTTCEKCKQEEGFFMGVGYGCLTKLIIESKAKTSYKELTQTKNDPVNPNHYKKAGLSSPIYLIKKYDLNFAVGNVIKYAARYKEKNGREDLKKALFYILWELDVDIKRIEEITKEIK